MQTQTAAPARVLLVEDDLNIGEALTHLLHDGGYEVERCFDGAEALKKLREGVHPDVILLDLMMPNLNGWEFRVEQREQPEWAAIPVVVMSADGSAQAAAIDADAHLRKPIDARQLLATVERLLQARQRAHAEASTVELDRMNSLGVLAAGLAHEINNPLAFVSGNLELAKLKCQSLEADLSPSAGATCRELARLLDHAQSGADRIAAVVRGVSAFARPDTEQVVAIDVEAVLESSLQLVAHEIRHRARLERDYAAVPSVLGNPAKLGQVFINLLINAAHAIQHGDAGDNIIRVSTRRGPGSTVVISIADSGSGIAPELIGRIFDPFFSTKPVGAGMGLGLSICRRLVSNMGGNITVESTPGRGATFSVTLPSAEAAQGDTQVALGSSPAASERRASLLVIDDEPVMCDLLRTMLEDQYDVTTFANPRAALAWLTEGHSFDVVLCDLMMPELTGMDLYSTLQRVRPEQAARFLFMTGGTFTTRASEFLDSIDGQPLVKPFRAHELYDAVAARLRQFESASRETNRAFN